MQRRRFFVLCAAVLTGSTGGCLEYVLGDDIPESEGPTRGQYPEPLEIHHVDERPETVVSYLPQGDSVRVVSNWRYPSVQAFREPPYPDEPPRFVPDHEIRPWEEWAPMEARRAASRSVERFVRDELATEEPGTRLRDHPDTGEPVVFVQIGTTVGRSGSVINEPAVEFETVVEATPPAVDVTYELDGNQFDMRVPVYAVHVVQQNLEGQEPD